MQALPQLVPLQVACAFGSDGGGQGVQLAPQELTLVSATHELSQTCVPAPHAAQTLPAQYRVAQSDALTQAAPVGQVFPCATQVPPQSTSLSFWLRIPSLQESSTHDPFAGWKPALQAMPQLAPSQVACALASVGWAHGVQLVPHVLVLVLETHALAQACAPGAQLAHTPPEQIWPAQSAGIAHAWPSPHGRPCEEQIPPQSTPVSFWLRMESVQESAAQEPLLGWNPALQAMPQLVPSQVATPFVTPGQGAHLDPQLLGLAFERQLLLQRCVPVLQVAQT